MDDRQFAFEILNATREILQRRLAETIIAREEEILADARGGSSHSAIDSIFDELSTKLNHVQILISQLPLPPPIPASEAEPPPNAAKQKRAKEPKRISQKEKSTRKGNAEADFAKNLPAIANALTTTSGSAMIAVTPRSGAPLWSEFAKLVVSGSLTDAASVLADLLETPLDRAIVFTKTFRKRHQADRDAILRVAELQLEIARRSQNGVLEILLTSFNIPAHEAIPFATKLLILKTTPRGV